MEDTFWSLVPKVSLLCKLHKHLQHLCWARVPLIFTCPHSSFQVILSCPPKCAPKPTCHLLPSTEKWDFSGTEMGFYVCWLACRDTGWEWSSHLMFETCEAAAECRTGAALCRRSQVYCGMFAPQSLHACTRQPASAHSILWDAACSCVCSFHCAVFSKFLSYLCLQVRGLQKPTGPFLVAASSAPSSGNAFGCKLNQFESALQRGCFLTLWGLVCL